MKKTIFALLFSLVVLGGCEEALVTKPFQLLTDDLAIVTAADAEQVLLGAYNALQTNTYGYGSIAYPGVLSDEMIHSGSFPTSKEMEVNQVLPGQTPLFTWWAAYYHGIFMTNVVLERIEKIKIDAAPKATIVAQARFIRALCHFDLAKFWGPVPIATVTNLTTLSSLSRTPQADVYAFCIQELTEAAVALKGVDYGAAGRDQEDRVKANEWGVKGLLARVYLYSGNKTAAAALANDIITNGGYTLPPAYATTFNGNSSETIFEVFQSSNDQSTLAFYFKTAGRYEYAPSAQLIAAFEAGDTRFSMILNPTTKPEANKYKDISTNSDRAIILRLADMYLIRAEAVVGTQAAADDINIVRNRAGLGNVTAANATLDVILKERFTEFCFEGHRWNDIIRTGRVNAIMGAINPTSYTPDDVLMPIPQADILQNPKILPQNPGY